MPVSQRSIYERTRILSGVNTLQRGNLVQNIGLSQDARRIQTLNPDWAVLIQKRKDASGYYFRRAIEFRNRSVDQYSRFWHPGRNAWVEDSGLIYPVLISGSFLSGVNESDDPSLKDLALKRLKRKLGDRANQMNVLIPLAEIRQMRGLITSLAFSATDLVKALIEVKRSKGKSAVQYASHLWLTWSFGVSPTLSDIAQLSSTINDVIAKRGGSHYTDFGSSVKTWKSSAKNSESSTYFCNSTIYCELLHKLSYRYAAGYRTPLRSANDYSVMSDFGLEWGSLPSTAWELVPFSWVVDYFTTAGEYLSDAFSSDGVTTTYVNCTKRYTCTGVYTVSPPLANFPQFVGTSSGEGSTFKWTVTDRTALSQLPTRSLRFKTADEIGVNAIKRLLNLSSVLVGSRAFSSRTNI